MATSAAESFDRTDQQPGGNGADWSNSYARFLSGSLANTQKTLRLYQQTLECVAAGRLPATVFQEYYPRFVQRHGAAYGDRLTQLCARFMGQLVELNRRNALHTASEGEQLASPVFDPAAPARWFEQYAEFVGKLNARALEAYRKQLDQVAEGELSPEEAQRKIAEDMSRRLPYYMHDAGQLYMQLMHDLDEIRGNYEEGYLGGILALADESAKEAVTAVTLQAPVGGMAFQSFTITNTTDARMPVRYVATEVRRMDGVGAAFAPRVAIDPEVLELEPGAEATVTFSLRLDADHYEVDVPYVGFLYFTSEGDRRVELQLRIVATEAVPEKEK